MSDLNVIGIDVTEVSEIPKHKPGLVCYTAATGSQVTDFYAYQEIVLNGY